MSSRGGLPTRDLGVERRRSPPRSLSRCRSIGMTPCQGPPPLARGDAGVAATKQRAVRAKQRRPCFHGRASFHPHDSPDESASRRQSCGAAEALGLPWLNAALLVVSCSFICCSVSLTDSRL